MVRRASLLAAAIAVVLWVSGCGVTATNKPVDEGDGVSGTTSFSDGEKIDLPEPNAAGTAEGLVRNFLGAATGGSAAANAQVKKYLTPDAVGRWVDPVNPDKPSLTVLRLLGVPHTGTPQLRRTPVVVDYQVVGQLSDLGRVDELAQPAAKSMTLWVVSDDVTNLRIDQIDGWPGGLVLSDEALADNYRIQPIYFWDTAYKTLVPDLRYRPRTLSADGWAGLVLSWLVAGPSPWLSGVQRFPQGTSPGPVVTNDGALQVNLSADAAAGGADALRRLMFELQWSLLLPGDAAPTIDLHIDDKPAAVSVGSEEFRQYNRSYALQGPASRFNITDAGKIEAVGGGGPAILSVPENANVVSAAIDGNGSLAVLVRQQPSGRRNVQIVHGGQPGSIATQVFGYDLGRPSLVPQSDVLLVPTGGRLLSVSTVDGSFADAVRPSGVSTATVSPDGRRVAYVADGQVYVASVLLGNNAVTLSSTPRQILAGQLTATAVTWTSESYLLVGGTAGGAPALWKVTADSVLATNLSDKTSVMVNDLVCYPQWTARGTADVLATTPLGVYTFRSLFQPEPGLRAPFFGQ